METCQTCQTPLPPEEWSHQCLDCDAYYSKKNIDHLIEHQGGYLVCLHCGGVHKHNGGSFSIVIAVLYAFRCDHTDCEPQATGEELKVLMAKEDLCEFKATLQYRTI